MNGNATGAATASGWNPGTLGEWVVYAVVGCFLWMVTKQNGAILPALLDLSAAIKGLPGAMKDTFRELIAEAYRAGKDDADRHHMEPRG